MVVNRSLLLLLDTGAAAVSVNQSLGHVGFGPKTFKLCDGGPQGATGRPSVKVDVHVGGNTRIRSTFCLVSCAIDANNGRGFFMSHAQFVEFFKMLTEPTWGAQLQVVRVGCPPSSDNSAILCEVDVPVDVAVAVGESVPLGLCGALLSCGGGLILPIYHQLNALLFPRLRRTEGVKVNILFFQDVQ